MPSGETGRLKPAFAFITDRNDHHRASLLLLSCDSNPRSNSNINPAETDMETKTITKVITDKVSKGLTLMVSPMTRIDLTARRMEIIRTTLANLPHLNGSAMGMDDMRSIQPHVNIYDRFDVAVKKRNRKSVRKTKQIIRSTVTSTLEISGSVITSASSDKDASA